MNLEDLAALSGFALALTCGPGPNNAMLSASGANYGWRLSVPHAMGVAVGFPVLIVAVAMGLERALGAFPRNFGGSQLDRFRHDPVVRMAHRYGRQDQRAGQGQAPYVYASGSVSVGKPQGLGTLGLYHGELCG